MTTPFTVVLDRSTPSCDPDYRLIGIRKLHWKIDSYSQWGHSRNKGDTMRNKTVLTSRLISAILTLSILIAGAVIATGQACGNTGCWELREPIYIYGNSGFTCDNGVVSGSGSQYDPFVIEGWHIVASGASFGISVENTSKHFVIRNCVIEGASEAGIHFYSVEKGSIDSCHILRNERGILFENSRDNGIVNSLIADNHYGADMVSGTRNTSISKNSFIFNGRNGYDPAGRNLWNCGTIGNYWSDYAGSDQDHNGIGDVPHHAPVDRYPLMTSPWQCALPVTDVCGLHCYDSTGILKQLATTTGPCATPCVPASSCTSTASCASAPDCAATSSCGSPCEPTINTCADQVLTCANPTATLTADFCPSRPTCEPSVIEWIKDGGPVIGTGTTIQVAEPGIYTVSIAGTDGCGVSKSISVVSDASTPVVRADVSGVLACGIAEVLLRASITGGCGPYDIQWNRSGEGVVGCEDCLLVSQPGTYTVTVTSATGCTATDTVIVTQDLQAPRISTMVDGELTCNVRQVKILALASNGRLPYTYEWHGPSGGLVGSTSELYVSEPGTYSVRVTGANGCSAMSTVIVTEDTVAPLVDINGGGLLTCSTTEIVLTANISRGRPPYIIEWAGPAGNIVGTAPMLTATTPGTYTVVVTGSNGCTTTATVAIDQDIEPPSVDAGPDQMLSNDVLQVLVAATIESPGTSYTVEWTNELGDVLSTMESFSVDRPGEYTVTVTRDTGCSAADTVAVNSSVITGVMLNSGIDGLAVFGQLTKDGVPIPGTTFYFLSGATQETEEGVEISSLSIRTGTGEGYEANGAEVNYIIPGNSVVTFQVHSDQFVAGKWYNLPHLPVDPPGAASVKFF